MNIFNRNRAKYPITAEAQREQLASNVNAAVYVVLLVMIAITGFHAVMIVMTQTAEFELTGWTGLALTILTVARVAFPLVVELGAAIAVVGSLKNMWRDDQKTWAKRIDTAWLIFAACNMVTFWSVERAAQLEGWQEVWLKWGMPISGIVVGWMVIVMIRAHPDNKRAEEEAAAKEAAAAEEFNDRQAIFMSEEMRTIRRRKIWRDIANSLPAEGYTQDEANFIMGQVPDMRSFVATKPAAPPPPDGLVDALFARLGIGKNAHDAPRQDVPVVPLAQPAPGQGERPNGATHPSFGDRTDFH